MNRKKDTAYGIKRIESKNARVSAIIQKIAADFNLMPIMAEAYYKQISSYFAEHADIKLTSGEICYEAVGADPLEKLATGDQLPEERYLRYGQLVWMAVPIDEYPERGKSIVKTRMKPIILTYLATEDVESFRNGFTSRQLRINRLVRWCHQAYDQAVLLIDPS